MAGERDGTSVIRFFGRKERTLAIEPQTHQPLSQESRVCVRNVAPANRVRRK